MICPHDSNKFFIISFGYTRDKLASKGVDEYCTRECPHIDSCPADSDCGLPWDERVVWQLENCSAPSCASMLGQSTNACIAWYYWLSHTGNWTHAPVGLCYNTELSQCKVKAVGYEQLAYIAPLMCLAHLESVMCCGPCIVMLGMVLHLVA